jgi:hypothetical protein
MIDKITSIEEGVKKLLTIRKRPVPDFKIDPRQSGDYLDTLIWNEQRIPLFDARFDSRIRRIARYGKESKGNSALNVYSFVGSDISLQELIYREFYIAEFILNSQVKKITAFANCNSANIIAVMENETCANMDLGNTMAPGSTNQCQHRLITMRGMANDRAVGNMTVEHQVNVYGQDSTSPTVYDDDEYYLYGLDDNQICKVLTIHGILTGIESYSNWTEIDARCQAAVEAVFESNRLSRTVFMGGV